MCVRARSRARNLFASDEWARGMKFTMSIGHLREKEKEKERKGKGQVDSSDIAGAGWSTMNTRLVCAYASTFHLRESDESMVLRRMHRITEGSRSGNKTDYSVTVSFWYRHDTDTFAEESTNSRNEKFGQKIFRCKIVILQI